MREEKGLEERIIGGKYKIKKLIGSTLLSEVYFGKLINNI